MIRSDIKSSALALVLILVASSVVMGEKPLAEADPEAPSVHWSVMAAGGGAVSLGSMQLQATIGQTCTGMASVGGMTVIAGYLQNFGSPGCCVGKVGDVNGSGDFEPTIGDISMLIDALYISVDMTILDCLTEADVNQSGGSNPQYEDITIGDISMLIDYLYITLPENMTIPDCF